MKKLGFTLAEVLITLGIIGVVAALSAPALVQSASTAKIGPILQKTVSTLENANSQLMQEEEIESLTSLGDAESFNMDVLNDTGKHETTWLPIYLSAVSKHIKGASYERMATVWEPRLNNYNASGDGFNHTDEMVLHLNNGVDIVFAYDYRSWQPAYGSLKGGLRNICIDVNGVKVKPNRKGKDVFLFYIDASGSVIAYGSTIYSKLNSGYKKYDSEDSSDRCDATSVGTGSTCGASILENNLKVIYK